MERLADRAILGRKSPPNGRGQIGPDAKTRVLRPRRQLSEIQEGDDDPGLTTVITDVDGREICTFTLQLRFTRVEIGRGFGTGLMVAEFSFGLESPSVRAFLQLVAYGEGYERSPSSSADRSFADTVGTGVRRLTLYRRRRRTHRRAVL